MRKRRGCRPTIGADRKSTGLTEGFSSWLLAPIRRWSLIPTPRLGRERLPANGSLLSGLRAATSRSWRQQACKPSKRWLRFISPAASLAPDATKSNVGSGLARRSLRGTGAISSGHGGLFGFGLAGGLLAQFCEFILSALMTLRRRKGQPLLRFFPCHVRTELS